jgi:hypothetical protein
LTAPGVISAPFSPSAAVSFRPANCLSDREIRGFAEQMRGDGVSLRTEFRTKHGSVPNGGLAPGVWRRGGAVLSSSQLRLPTMGRGYFQ